MVNTKKDKNVACIFNIQNFSIQDGPGIRTTVFLKGCPLRCEWCANPESQNAHPEIMLLDIKCIKCGICVDVCPVGAITIADNIRVIDRNKCNLCMKCAESCPTGAIEAVGQYLSVEEAFNKLAKDSLFYFNSEGGVTFSGGEPLWYWGFMQEICRLCKEKEIHTALDTCGYASWEVMETVLENTDLVLYDIKHLDPVRHEKLSGVSNELILSNLRRVVNRTKTWIRIPLIPGYNDSETYFRKLSQFVRELSRSSNGKVEKVSLLPYHDWGKQKYLNLGRDYPFDGTPLHREEYIQRLRDIMERSGVKTSLRA